MAKNTRANRRVARHERVRKDVHGTPERPRLCVFRSNKNIFAQVVDDVNGVTLAAASTLEKELEIANGGNKEAAKKNRRSCCKESAGEGYRNSSLR